MFFDAKPYDRIFFDHMKEQYQIEIDYFEPKLGQRTAFMAKGYDIVVAFVNDIIDKDTIETLYQSGVKVIAYDPFPAIN